MVKNDLYNEYSSIGYGDHICLFYATIEDYKYVAINYIIDGLINNNKVVCVVHEYPKDLLIQDLIYKNIDANKFINVGQLEIFSINDKYLGENGFVISNWHEKQQSAINEGYKGIRVMGEAIFALHEDYGLDKLMEYELKCNSIDRDKQVAMCIYNKKEFPEYVLEDMAHKHSVIINERQLIKPNPYFIGYDKLVEQYMKKIAMKKHLSLGVSNKYPIGTNSIKKNREAAILKHVISSTGDGVWEWDLQTTKVFLNESFLRMLGYPNKEVIVESKRLLRLVHPEDSFAFRKQVEECFKQEVENIDYELRIKDAKGNWVWFNIRGTVTERDDVSGEALKAVGVFINISEKRKIKEELDLKNNLDKIKTDYFTNLSHELRTPLNVIFGSLQLQNMYMKNDASSEYIDKYIKIHKRMKQNCYRL
ncbi:MEDS domain-containing protein [Serpentinicella alkaliphila]|uniref:histidine kinase n=1 Tax=Serpentinicella alkaliphila TaxID=1734049 RepID=A0A4R2TH45_9FIRM|nr:MEDS domain-containing protein [Serpentinicella alkaliphila]QUH25026.1 MEDS domain-containing protein [Serpentinicella alkaliphila]TCQ02491.1 PAS domain S-box-containing protein [Serpentinicella alkaliphila]